MNLDGRVGGSRFDITFWTACSIPPRSPPFHSPPIDPDAAGLSEICDSTLPQRVSWAEGQSASFAAATLVALEQGNRVRRLSSRRLSSKSLLGTVDLHMDVLILPPAFTVVDGMRGRLATCEMKLLSRSSFGTSDELRGQPDDAAPGAARTHACRRQQGLSPHSNAKIAQLSILLALHRCSNGVEDRKLC